MSDPIDSTDAPPTIVSSSVGSDELPPSYSNDDTTTTDTTATATTIGSSLSSPTASASASLTVSSPTAGDSHTDTHSRSSSLSSPRSIIGTNRPVASSSSAASSSSSATSPDTAFRRELQSIRAADLDAEHHLWSHGYGLEESYWLKQEERFHLVLKRAHSGAASARDLHAYLKRTSKLLSSVSDQLQNLGSFGQVGECASIRSACMAVDIVRKTTSSYLGELNTRVFGESLRAAGQSSEDAARLAHTIESAGNDMVRQLRAQRRVTSEAWQQYYKQSQERARVESQGGKIKSDPFLLARVYESEMYQLQTVETKFQSLMASLLKDVQAEEIKRMAAMKFILVDNLTAQTAVLSHSQKFTENALATVKAIQPEQDLQEFLAAADLYIQPASATNANTATATTVSPSIPLSSSSSSSSLSPSSSSASLSSSVNNPTVASVTAAVRRGEVTGADSSQADQVLSAHAETSKAVEVLSNQPIISFLAPPPTRDPFAMARVYSHEIDKSGQLYRQGAVIKSNWKPTTAYLTTSGFLHLFEDKKSRQSHSSWSLSDATVESGDSVHPLAFGLRFVKSGFSLSGSERIVYFRAENSDELMEWVHHANKHVIQAGRIGSGGSASPVHQQEGTPSPTNKNPQPTTEEESAPPS